MATYLDPRLLRSIRDVGESGQVEAIIVAKEDDDSSLTAKDGGSVGKVIDSAIERTGDSPISLRYFPRANAAVITASSRFMHEILQNEDLAVASATEIDLIFFLRS